MQASGLKRMVAENGVPIEHIRKDRPSRPGTGATLLDSVGRFTRNIGASEVAAWLAELKSPELRKSRSEQLRIWLAEYTLRGELEPQKALEEIEEILRTMPAASPLRGVATVDLGIAEFATGRYRRAADTLSGVLTSKLTGFDRKAIAALAKHAISCATYHEDRARAGITEPTHLDPLCGASGLAIALRFLGKAHGKEQVVQKTPHTGFGSTMADLEKGARNLGLTGRTLKMDEDGLRAYFKVNGGMPVITRVEHDHYVAVTEVNDKGVTYWCSDCGPWPGGKRQLNWSQWRMMEADAFLAIAVPGSDLSKAISLLPSKGTDFTWLRAMAPAWGAQSMSAEAQRILSVLTNASVSYNILAYFIDCGLMPTCLQCVDCYPECPEPLVEPLATADPVNLANGVEEYTAPSGLHVYNPSGPSVSWAHSYNSLAQVTPNGWGQGWHHPYLLTMYMVHYPETQSEEAYTGGSLIMPNSAAIAVNFDTATAPTTGQTFTGTVEPGFPYIATWTYDSTEQSDFMEITSASRTKYRFKKLVQRLNDSNAWQWYLVSVTDRNGLKIKLTWEAMAFSEFNLLTRKHAGYGLTSVNDASGTPLLTLEYDEDAHLVEAKDRYERSIYYANDEFMNEYGGFLGTFGHDELTAASVVCETGTQDPEIQYEYDYTLVYNSGQPQGGSEKVPFLHKIRTINPDGSNNYSEATITYFNQGWVSQTTDANGNVAVFTSNTDGSTTVEHIKNSVVELKYTFKCAANMAWTQFKNADGDIVIKRIFSDSDTPFRPSSVQVGDGTNPPTWTFDWDQYSQLLSTTTPKDVTTTYTRSFTNFALGEVTEVEVGDLTSTQFTYYQPSGQVHEVKTPIPGEVGTNNRQTTTYEYDSMGNVTSVTSPGNNAGATRTATLDYGSTPMLGLPISATDPLDNETTFTYTERGMQETVTDPLGNMTETTYTITDQVDTVVLPATGSSGTGHAQLQNTYLFPGGPLTQANALDESGSTVRTVDYTYGKEGELLTKTGSTEPVTLTYNSAYMTKTVADGNSNATTYTYNTKGQLTKISYPGATGANFDQIQFSNYDLLGRALTRVDGRGQETTYTYGDLDLNLTEIEYASDSSQNVTIEYDDYDRVTELVDGSGSATAEYDDLGLTSEATRTYTGISAKTATYTYYPDGSRETMVNPAGTWEYLYDLNGRCTEMESPAGTSEISYFDNGWIAGRTLPNGSYSTYTYNALGLLTELVNKKSDNSSQSSFGSTSFDGAFNLTAMTASIASPSSFSGSTTWSYDTKDRLINETSTRLDDWDHDNAYDGASNPTTFKNNTRTYNANNQLTVANMAYDGNGNPTTYNRASMTYDVENRITSVGMNSTLTNGYRADGLRAWKQPTTGGKTYFLYDGGNPIVEMNSSGTVTNVNVYAPDGLVARKEGSTWSYYAFDMQGNVINKLSSSEAVTSGRLLDAWGQGVETVLPITIDPFGYNAKWGYYYDRETQLYLCQHRMYDASAGRWLNRDPIGYAGGVNLYGYCGAGPVGSADPSGYAMDSVRVGVLRGGKDMAETVAIALGVGAAATGGYLAVDMDARESVGGTISRLAGRIGTVCEPVTDSDDLGNPDDWENTPLPRDPNEPKTGPGPFTPPSQVPKREQNPRTRTQTYTDMVNRLQPDRETKEDCYNDFITASKAIGKAFGNGALTNREARRLYKLAEENYDRCMSRASDYGDF